MDRKHTLQQERQKHEKAIVDLHNWLLKNFNHEDRPKIYRDLAWHKFERDKIDQQLANLNAGMPENGYSSEIEQLNLTRTIINKTQS